MLIKLFLFLLLIFYYGSGEGSQLKRVVEKLIFFPYTMFHEYQYYYLSIGCRIFRTVCRFIMNE